MSQILKNQLAGMIEATRLEVSVTQEEIGQLCEQAIPLRLYGVCVPPCWVKYACKRLGQTGIKTITVAGFPYGYERVNIKAYQLQVAAEYGAHEVDYVINISGYFSEGVGAIKAEAQALSKVAKDHGLLLKGIIETALLSDAQKIESAKVLFAAGVDMIKTSTGTIAGGGAKTKDVILLRKRVSSDMKIKASGEIRTFRQAWALVKAGACRIGTSHAAEILERHGASTANH